MASVGVREATKESEIRLLGRLEGLLEDARKDPSVLDGLQARHLAPLIKCLNTKTDSRVKSRALDLISVIVESAQNEHLVWHLASEVPLLKLNQVLISECERDAARGLRIFGRLLDIAASSPATFPVDLVAKSGLPYAVASVFSQYSDIILGPDFQNKSKLQKKRIIYVWGSAAVCLIKIQNLIPPSSPASTSTFTSPCVESILRTKALNILKAVASDTIELEAADSKNLKMCLLYYLANALASKTSSEEFCQQRGTLYISQLLRTNIRAEKSDDDETFDSITEILIVIRAVVRNGFGSLFFHCGLVVLLVACLRTFTVSLISQTYDPTVNHSVLICICEILLALFYSDIRSLEQFVNINGVEILSDFQQSCYPASFVVIHLLSVVKDETVHAVEVNCQNRVDVAMRRSADEDSRETATNNGNMDTNNDKVKLIFQPKEKTNCHLTTNDRINSDDCAQACYSISSDKNDIEFNNEYWSDDETQVIHENNMTEDRIVIRYKETTVTLNQVTQSIVRTSTGDSQYVISSEDE